ncbi:hypothetical protein CCR75_000855 [Bremia lactucae]|uniref:Uncharacterized protein n=1 Tax=Bremia lactucae TaxID=4779 RepID=A0A976FP76_BRELC|nr:hypothetical protein CCR75_000855 [Bremia lactucae]
MQLAAAAARTTTTSNVPQVAPPHRTRKVTTSRLKVNNVTLINNEAEDQERGFWGFWRPEETKLLRKFQTHQKKTITWNFALTKKFKKLGQLIHYRTKSEEAVATELIKVIGEAELARFTDKQVSQLLFAPIYETIQSGLLKYWRSNERSVASIVQLFEIDPILLSQTRLHEDVMLSAMIFIDQFPMNTVLKYLNPDNKHDHLKLIATLSERFNINAPEWIRIHYKNKQTEVVKPLYAAAIAPVKEMVEVLGLKNAESISVSQIRMLLGFAQGSWRKKLNEVIEALPDQCIYEAANELLNEPLNDFNRKFLGQVGAKFSKEFPNQLNPFLDPLAAQPHPNTPPLKGDHVPPLSKGNHVQPSSKENLVPPPLKENHVPPPLKGNHVPPPLQPRKGILARFFDWIARMISKLTRSKRLRASSKKVGSERRKLRQYTQKM